MDSPVEVFEIVDRYTNRRLIEGVFLTAQQALNRLEPWPDLSMVRVQSVTVLHG